MKIYLRFVFVGALCMAPFACKSRENATDLLSVNDARIDAEKRRINGEIDFELIPNDKDGSKYWLEWQNTGYPVYKMLWTETYQDFLVRTQGYNGYDLKRYAVSFYISSKPRVYLKTEPRQLPTKKPSYANQPEKQCGPDIKSKAKYVLSFDLANCEQPSLTRNLLILAKMGYYDGMPFLGRYKGAGIFHFGANDSPGDPYFLRPDLQYSTYNAPKENNEELDVYKSEGKDLRELSSFDLPSLRSKIKVTTSAGSLMGMAFSLGTTEYDRRILATMMGVSYFKSALEEARFQKEGIEPVRYGSMVKLSTNDANSSDLAKLEYETASSSTTELTIDCVEIHPPKLAKINLDQQNDALCLGIK